MTADAQLERGAFRLASYEWGVTYSAMLAAAEATGDQAYYKYVTDRFSFWPRLLRTSVRYWKVWNCRSADETNSDSSCIG